MRSFIHVSESNERANIDAAIAEFESKTCMTFENNANADHRIEVIKGSGCWSFIGRQSGSSQQLSLGQGCATFVSIIAHLVDNLFSLVRATRGGGRAPTRKKEKKEGKRKKCEEVREK